MPAFFLFITPLTTEIENSKIVAVTFNVLFSGSDVILDSFDCHFIVQPYKTVSEIQFFDIWSHFCIVIVDCCLLSMIIMPCLAYFIQS